MSNNIQLEFAVLMEFYFKGLKKEYDRAMRDGDEKYSDQMHHPTFHIAEIAEGLVSRLRRQKYPPIDKKEKE